MNSPPLTHVPCFSPPCRYSVPAQLPSRIRGSPASSVPFPGLGRGGSSKFFFSFPQSQAPSSSTLLFLARLCLHSVPCCAVMNGGGAGDQPLLAGTVSFLSPSSGADQLRLFLCSPRKAESRGSELEHGEICDTLKWRQGCVCLFVTTCRNAAFHCKVICCGKSSWYFCHN